MLAAGRSRRFGWGVKVLAQLRGRPLLHHAIERARGSGAGRVLVVTGAARGRVERAVRAWGLKPVFARDYCLGMGASLRAGLRAVRPIEREVVIFLGDMPLAAMPCGLRLAPGKDAARPVYGGSPGHPLMVRTGVARHLVAAGDRGLAAALDQARVALVRGGAGATLDLDDRASLRRLRWTPPR